MFYRSDTFWKSFAGVFDYWGTFGPFYYRRDPWKADYEALSQDWKAVGADLRTSMSHFERDYAKELERAGPQRLFDPDEKS